MSDKRLNTAILQKLPRYFKNDNQSIYDMNYLRLTNYEILLMSSCEQGRSNVVETSVFCTYLFSFGLRRQLKIAFFFILWIKTILNNAMFNCHCHLISDSDS